MINFSFDHSPSSPLSLRLRNTGSHRDLGLLRPIALIMKRHPLLIALSLLVLSIVANGQPYLGNGIKIGDTTDASAIVWVRLTELAQPKWEGLKWLGVTDREFDVGVLGEKQFPKGATLPEMEGNL